MEKKDEDMSFGEYQSSSTVTVDDLSVFLRSRTDTLADRLIPSEPLVDWHNMLYCVSPRELQDAVNTVVQKGIFTIQEGNFSNYLVYNNDLGEMKIETGRPSFAWNENSATEELIITLTFDRIYLNDYQTLSKANQDYPTLQVMINSQNKVVVRSFQTLKGGRTVSNLMWTLIQFYHDADRFHRDVVIYN